MKNLKIGARLGIGFLSLIILLLGMAGAGVWALKDMHSGVESMMQNSVAVERDAREMARAAAVQGKVVYNFSYAVQPEMIKRFYKEIVDIRIQIDGLIKHIESANLTETEKTC